MSDLLYTNGPVPYREDLFRAFREAGIEVRFGVPSGGLRSEWERVRPDRVFVPEFSAMALAALHGRKRFGFKVISLCDDSMDMIRGNDFGWKHRLARRVIPRFLDGIILHSPDVRQWYRSRFGKGFFMPIIADERRIRPELERVLPLSRQVRPTGKPIVAFVGRLVGLKNIPTFLRAFEPLHDRAQLVLIGDGPEHNMLESMAPRALFTGFLSGEERLAWYNLIDILVLPSLQEAYGAVTGEALMAGAKVAVSRKAGSSDLVREGENGYLFDPLDEKGLTACLEKLLETLPDGRPVTLRENLLPYRFETCIQDLLKEINAL